MPPTTRPTHWLLTPPNNIMLCQLRQYVLLYTVELRDCMLLLRQRETDKLRGIAPRKRETNAIGEIDMRCNFVTVQHVAGLSLAGVDYCNHLVAKMRAPVTLSKINTSRSPSPLQSICLFRSPSSLRPLINHRPSARVHATLASR